MRNDPSRNSRAICRVLLIVLLGLIGRTGAHGSGLPIAVPGASTPLPGYTITYVSAYGSDMNDGLSWGSAKATIGAALAALPNCTTSDVNGNSYTLSCGKVEISPGRLSIGSPLSITSPLVSLIGGGSASTHLTWTGTGCGITVDVGSGSAILVPGPTFQGFTIDGAENRNDSSCGIHYTNNSRITLRDIVISDFSARADSCLLGTTGPSLMERVIFEHVYLGNCTTGWNLQNTNSDGTFSTSGYGDIDIYINVKGGQTGITSQGNGPSQPLFMSQSLFHILINLDAPTANCANLSNYSQWFDNAGFIRCDGAGATAFTLDATSQFIFDGVFSTEPRNIVPNGAVFLARDMARQPSSDFPTFIQQFENSTATNTGEGFSYYLAGTYWSGNASALDQWKFQLQPSSTSSDLIWQHVSGPPFARFNFVGDACIYPEGGGFGGPNNCLVSQASGYYSNILPASSGTLALQGSNGVSAGTTTLSFGSASHVFQQPYSATPVCTGTDTTSDASVQVTASNTAINLIGKGSDEIAWICAPPAN